MSEYYGPGTDDISFIPLTREEEKALFLAYYAGDLSARDEIIARHLKFVARLSLRLAKRALPEDEAISAGNFALMKALESRKFNPNRGFRFATYLRKYLLGRVCSALRERGTPETTPTRYGSTKFPDDAAVTGNVHTRDEIHPADCVTRTSYEKLIEIETAVDHGYEAKQLNEERRRAIEVAMKSLGKTEQMAVRAVLFNRKGFLEVSKKRKISRQGVHQAYWSGMKKLKTALLHRRKELS